MLNYSETVEWMFQQLPMYQRIGADAFKKDLTNILKFAEVLGNPHKKFKAVHVAGTNGKGSTSHMLASVFQEAGYKVGLYTSPHLRDYRERIKINGKEISEEEVVRFISGNKEFLGNHQLSFFEMSVGMAFDHFMRHAVDIAVIEVGLGGRLDSTNIILPELSVITNIGMDHVKMLGDSLAKIAFEKAGIIKNEVPVVIGETHTETSGVFKEIAEKRNSEIIFADQEPPIDFESDLKGSYQKKNIQTVVVSINKLNEQGWSVLNEDLKNGLLKVKKNTGLRGRWDVLGTNPKIICDTAHNKEGLEIVLDQLLKENYKDLHIVMGVVNDKDLENVLPLFPLQARYYFSKPDVPRGLDAEILQIEAGKFGLNGSVFPSVQKAFEAAKNKASKEGLVFVGGSTFTVAEII